MMPESANPWFRLGLAFERTLQTLSSPGGTISTLRQRRESEGAATSQSRGREKQSGGHRSEAYRPPDAPETSPGDGDTEASSLGSSAAARVKQALDHLPIDEEELSHVVDALFAAGAGTVVSRLLERWGKGGGRSTGSFLRAGAAGAGAALVMEAMRPLLEKDGKRIAFDADLAYALMEGAGRGLVYGLLLHRRIPGPPAMRGAVFGTAEYLVGPWGGVSHLLHPLTPQSSLPVVGPLLQPGDTSQDTLVEHLLFGTSLGLLYGIGGEE